MFQKEPNDTPKPKPWLDHSTVRRKTLPGDVCGFVGRQEKRTGGNVLCGRPATHRYVLQGACLDLRRDMGGHGVSTKPGAIALTRIFHAPTSRANERVKPNTPAFAAE